MRSPDVTVEWKHYLIMLAKISKDTFKPDVIDSKTTYRVEIKIIANSIENWTMQLDKGRIGR